MIELPHPIKVYRREAGLTQAALATLLEKEDLSLMGEDNVSEQWVRRLELGLVNPDTNFVPVARELVRLMAGYTQGNDVTVEKLLLRYTGLLLANSTEPLRVDAPLEQNYPQYIVWQIRDWYDVKRQIAYAELADEQKNYTLPVHPEVLQQVICRDLGEKETVYSFCRALGLHPFSVQSWVKVNSMDPQDWPAPVRAALVDIGLGDYVEAYRRL